MDMYAMYAHNNMGTKSKYNYYSCKIRFNILEPSYEHTVFIWILYDL